VLKLRYKLDEQNSLAVYCTQSILYQMEMVKTLCYLKRWYKPNSEMQTLAIYAAQTESCMLRFQTH